MEMAQSVPPNSESALKAMFKVAIGEIPTLAEGRKWSNEFTSFLKRLFVIDPAKRATAAELLKDPWLEAAETRKVMQVLLQHCFVEKSLESLLV